MAATTIERSSAGRAPWARLLATEAPLGAASARRPRRADRPVGRPIARPVARPATRPAPAPLVFRRRRVAVAALLMLMAFAAGMLIAITLLSSPAGGSLTDEARRAQQVTYVVQPGDTLWRAAERLAPRSDPRAVVDALSTARGTSEVRPGEVLVWPVG